MIIKGKSRAAAAQAGAYLLNKGKNEKVELIEIKETVSENVKDAMREMEAVAAGSRSEKFLYHASINLQEGESLTPEQWKYSVDLLEKNLNLEGHQRVVVEHNKDGRTHQHIIWNRVDSETIIATHMSNSYATHEKTARELEKTFGLKHVKGVHVLEENEKPANRAPTHNEIAQSKKTGVNLHKWRNEIREIAQGRSGEELINALDGRGHTVAHGDKVDFVILDPSGTPQRMAQSLGLKVKELKERLSGVNPENLPNAEQARERQKEIQAELEKEKAAKMYDHGGMVSQQRDAMHHVKDKYEARKQTPQPTRPELMPIAEQERKAEQEKQKEENRAGQERQKAEQEQKKERGQELAEWIKRRGSGKSQAENKVQDKRTRTEQTDRKQRKSTKDVIKELTERSQQKRGGEKEWDFERERDR